MPTAPANTWGNRASPCQSSDGKALMSGRDHRHDGLVAGASAYFIWGFLPLLLKALQHVPPRSEERSEGKEGVSKCRSRWTPDHKKEKEKKKQTKNNERNTKKKKQYKE